MTYNRKAFGVAVSDLRIRMGWTQEKLAAEAGISRSHLALVESGKKAVRLDTLWQIANALQIRPSELIKRTEGSGVPSEKQGAP